MLCIPWQGYFCSSFLASPQKLLAVVLQYTCIGQPQTIRRTECHSTEAQAAEDGTALPISRPTKNTDIIHLVTSGYGLPTHSQQYWNVQLHGPQQAPVCMSTKKSASQTTYVQKHPKGCLLLRNSFLFKWILLHVWCFCWPFLGEPCQLRWSTFPLPHFYQAACCPCCRIVS